MNKGNLFNSIQVKRNKTNVFDLSHDVKLSCNMGFLVPTLVMECIPGDKWNISCESLLRFAPLVAPVMHRVDVYMHYFFVPNRILWDNWEKFITNTPLYDGGPLPAVPYMNIQPDGSNYTKLMNYMGIPNPTAPGSPGDAVEKVQAMPFAAYQKIWQDYYRDQNMIPEQFFGLIDGDNTSDLNLTILQKRAWEHDYFTSCLPFAQKGDPVTLPIAGFQDVNVRYNLHNISDPTTEVDWAAAPLPTAPDVNVGADRVSDPGLMDGGLIAETSALTGQEATINDLRRAFRLQEWLEKAARGGSRYIESILAHFGVRSSDKRLQRPEYITGTKSPVIISEVLNTTGTSTAPQGTMAGHGVAVTAGNYGKYFCEEHGFIIGIMSILPKTAYQQGIAKMWLKWQDPFQHYWQEFANIGEQEVQVNELYAYANDQAATFGYVPRYAEYKFMSNRVAGDFQTSLDFWHMGRIFDTHPNLNKAFIEADPTTRIFAVSDTDVDHLWVQVLHKISAVRQMPKFGTPSF